MFAAKLAILIERQLLLHFLLVSLRNDRDLLTFAASKLCHILLNDSHIC